MNQKYPTPSVAWLQITGYTHDWLYHEFGGSILLHGKQIVSIAHLPEARKILRMQTQEDIMGESPNRISLSAMRMDCLQLGCSIGPKSMQDNFKITTEQLNLFVPIECPRMALTKYGVLRPWDRTTAFGKEQANSLLNFLRRAFWQAVAEHEQALTEKGQKPETAIKLIESFCQETGTSDVWVSDLRREWQRQCNAKKNTRK